MPLKPGDCHVAFGDSQCPGLDAGARLEARARKKVPDSRLLHNNTCTDLLAIAEQMLDGEIEYRKGNYEVAFAHLRRSVELDDALLYDEPWGWIQPSRHDC